MRLTASFIAVTVGCYALVGCTNNKAPEKDRAKAKEEKIQAALAKLSPEDRKLAEAQKFCPVQTKERLGSMGTPVKVNVNGEAVFLCCAHCEDDVKKDKDGILKKVKELRAVQEK